MRFTVILFLFYALSACGFQPVHGTKPQETSTGGKLEKVQVRVANQNRTGQLFTIALEDALHPSNHYPEPDYLLTSSLEEIKQPIIIERDASITRYNLVLRARYSVQNLKTGDYLLRDKLSQRISSYNVSDSDFATFIADREARERGIEELARTISMELVTLLQDTP